MLSKAGEACQDGSSGTINFQDLRLILNPEKLKKKSVGPLVLYPLCSCRGVSGVSLKFYLDALRGAKVQQVGKRQRGAGKVRRERQGETRRLG